MPFADQYTKKARLTIKGTTFPVLVRVHEITDVRDGRIHEWGGTLWANDAPANIRAPHILINFGDQQATLTFADGSAQEVLLASAPSGSGGTYISTFSHIQHRHNWDQGDED